MNIPEAAVEAALAAHNDGPQSRSPREMIADALNAATVELPCYRCFGEPGSVGCPDCHGSGSLYVLRTHTTEETP